MKIRLFTFGCFANKDNSEIIKGLCNEKDYEITEKNDADVFIVNSCIVKHTTENKIIYLLKKLKDKYPDKKIILTGCMPQAEYEKVKNLDIILVNTFNITNIIGAIEEGKDYLTVKKERKINLPKNDSKIIQIAEGCTNECYFCQTKLAKGELYSYPIKDIIKEVKNSIKKNKKIYLTATDCGCYGFDINTNLLDLLNEIISIKKDFKIRVGMMNPEHVLKYLDELIEIYKDEKIIKFIHIPIQSGSDKVLKEMNRNYKVKNFKKIVNKFRKEIPKINISTDIIIGYPTETEEDFQKTLKLIGEIKPEVLNISKFSSRKGTKASKLKPLKSEIIKERMLRLNKKRKN